VPTRSAACLQGGNSHHGATVGRGGGSGRVGAPSITCSPSFHLSGNYPHAPFALKCSLSICPVRNLPTCTKCHVYTLKCSMSVCPCQALPTCTVCAEVQPVRLLCQEPTRMHHTTT
jgi:hypothetical protein